MLPDIEQRTKKKQKQIQTQHVLILFTHYTYRDTNLLLIAHDTMLLSYRMYPVTCHVHVIGASLQGL